MKLPESTLGRLLGCAPRLVVRRCWSARSVVPPVWDFWTRGDAACSWGLWPVEAASAPGPMLTWRVLESSTPTTIEAVGVFGRMHIHGGGICGAAVMRPQQISQWSGCPDRSLRRFVEGTHGVEQLHETARERILSKACAARNTIRSLSLLDAIAEFVKGLVHTVVKIRRACTAKHNEQSGCTSYIGMI